MVVINLPAGTHTVKWTLNNYYDLVATIRISSSGQVTCVSVTSGSCGGYSTPRVIVSGTSVTGYLKSRSGQTTPTPQPTYTPPPSGAVYETVLADKYVGIVSPMAKVYSPSSDGNYYVHCTPDYSSRGHVKYKFNIPKAGRYKIVGLVSAESHSHNSFNVMIDSQSKDAWDITPKSGWQWVNMSKRGSGSDTRPQYPIYYNDFGPSNHYIYIYCREGQTKLRKLIITNNLSYIPGSPTPTSTPPPGTYTSFSDWSSKHGGQSGLRGNLNAYLELGPAYLRLGNIGFNVTLSNLLDAGRYYLGL